MVRQTFATSTWIFFRGLGAVYAAAFLSLAVQVRGLIGHRGILPADEFLSSVRAFADAQHVGLERFRLFPTIFWFRADDVALSAMCIAGIALAVLLVVGLLPLVVLPLLWIDYLSLSVVSREFLSFQWDALLLEIGLLAIFLAPPVVLHRWRSRGDPPTLARWLLWWLLFRLMFESGVVKLTSGDPSWRTLTALAFHYETQPIPTPIAWYAYQLPLWFQKISTAAVLIIELGVPWLIAAPRRVRHLAAVVMMTLQILIALTGNYAFFNLLTIVLCALLLDDDVFGRMAGSRQRSSQWRWPPMAAAALTVPLSLVILASQLGMRLPAAELLTPLESVMAPLQSVNGYGLFAVMTTTRPEIVVEGSDDGRRWTEYAFKFKPGDIRRGLPWVAPHQPRLDWQMWFAALGRYEDGAGSGTGGMGWFQRFCVRLLEGAPEVVGLLEKNPFPARPPTFVRGVLYQYRFADRDTRRLHGDIWVRERIGFYSPTLSLRR